MPKPGRKRKPGPRTPSDRLSRATFDHGSERAQHMRAIYGEDYVDAIGRAFRSGLLGEGTQAKAMLDTARAIASAYWQAYNTGPIRCTLGDNAGATTEPDHDRIRKREEWLASCLQSINRMGVRSQFDQLVIDINPDCGPAWLDSLIYSLRAGKPTNIEHQRTLRAALDALETIAS